VKALYEHCLVKGHYGMTSNWGKKKVIENITTEVRGGKKRNADKSTALPVGEPNNRVQSACANKSSK